MKSVTIINRLAIKSGKMQEFIDLQQKFAARLVTASDALLGGRLYRSADDSSAVLVSQFRSMNAQEEMRQSDIFKKHLAQLAPLIESSSPGFYEEAYTTGDFR